MTDGTRRDWLITISTAAAATCLAGHLTADGVAASKLPPGVYDPSTDYLSHALMSAERYHPIPPGCPTEYVRPLTGAFDPSFFSRTEFPVIRRLVQVLLGESSGQTESVEETAEWIDLCVSEAGNIRKAMALLTPAHRTLAVAYYGASRVDRIAAEDPAQICREGLTWISKHHKDFPSLTFQQQSEVVVAMSEDTPDSPALRFYTLLKAETIKGFYTSRSGLKELDFKGNAFYARSPGCSTQDK